MHSAEWSARTTNAEQVAGIFRFLSIGASLCSGLGPVPDATSGAAFASGDAFTDGEGAWAGATPRLPGASAGVLASASGETGAEAGRAVDCVCDG